MLLRKQLLRLLVVVFFLLYIMASYYVASTAQDVLWVSFLPLIPSAFLLLVITRAFTLPVKLLFAQIMFFVFWFIGIKQQCFSCLYLLQYNAIMLAFMTWFGYSLLPNKQALCTQFSACIHVVVSERLASYTRAVTLSWTVFFLLMLLFSVALYYFVSIEAWSFFTYFLTAPLVGSMFLAEYIIRKQLLPPSEALDFMSAIRAYRLYNQANTHGH